MVQTAGVGTAYTDTVPVHLVTNCKDWASDEDEEDVLPDKPEPPTPPLEAGLNGDSSLGNSTCSNAGSAGVRGGSGGQGSTSGYRGRTGGRSTGNRLPRHAPPAPPLPPKPARPDDSEIKAGMNALQELLSRTKARLEEIEAQIRRRPAAGHGPKRHRLEARLKQLLQQRSDLEAQQRSATGEAAAARSAHDATKRRLLSMRRSGAVLLSADAVDARIMEVQDGRGTLADPGSRNVQQQLEHLNILRGHVKDLEAARQGADAPTVEQLEKRVLELDSQLASLAAQEGEIRASLLADEEATAAAHSLPAALWAERDESKEICRAAYTKLREMREEQNRIWAEFKAANKQYKQALESWKARKAWHDQRRAREAMRAAAEAEVEAVTAAAVAEVRESRADNAEAAGTVTRAADGASPGSRRAARHHKPALAS